MNHIIKLALFFLLATTPLITASERLSAEEVCADVTYPLNGCDAITLCPKLCELHSKVWTGQFGTSTEICDDQQKEGNAVCECVRE